MAFVLFGLPELGVGAVEPVQNTEDAKTLIEPEVVEVMELRRGQEGKVVSTVRDSGAHQSHAVPQGGRGQVGAQEDRPEYHRQHVGDDVLQRMSVNGDESDGSGPLMVLFVVILVEAGMVEQPVGIIEENFLRDGEDG